MAKFETSERVVIQPGEAVPIDNRRKLALVIPCSECKSWVPSLGREWTTTGRCKRNHMDPRNRNDYCSDGKFKE